jgi:hypothetical protein
MLDTKARFSALAASGAVVAALAGSPNSAGAEPSVISMPITTCTATLCGTNKFNARISQSFTNSNPFVAQFSVNPERCAVFEVIATNQANDLEMALVAPNGTTFTDDDGGAGLNPRVVIANPFRGIYTMVLNHFTGLGIDDIAVIKFAQYNLGNPNCAGATVGQIQEGKVPAEQRTPTPQLEQIERPGNRL